MKKETKIILGTLAGAGVLAFLLSESKHNTCKSNAKKVKNFIKNEEENFEDKKEAVKENIADKIFDFAVNNRQAIANVTSIFLPFVLKNFVKKKL